MINKYPKLNSIFYYSLLILFIFLGFIPVFYTLVISIFDKTAFTDGLNSFNFKLLILLIKSILIASTIAAFSTLTGLFISYILTKTNILFKSSFKIIILSSLFIPPYILAVAWKDFLFTISGNSHIFSSVAGLIIVLTSVFTPLAVLIISDSIRNINASIEESGLMTTSKNKVFIKIILPLIKPGLTSSFVLIFIFSISNFAVHAFLGVKVFTTEIFTQFSAFYKHSLAVFQSFILIFICLSLLLSEIKYISNASFFSFGNKGNKVKIYKNKINNLYYTSFLIFWIFISIILPLTVLIISSFSSKDNSFIKAFNLLLPTFSNSLFLSLVSSVIIVIIGFSVAYREFWLEKNTKIFNFILLFLFTIPSTVYGISLIKFYNNSMLNFIYSSLLIIIIAYTGKFAFIAGRLISNNLKQIPKSYKEAALLSGASKTKIMIKILLPLILPAILSSFIISFIFSFGELGTTIMIYPPGTEILPVKIYTIMANAPESLIASMNLILFTVTLLMILIFYWLTKRLFLIKSHVYS